MAVPTPNQWFKFSDNLTDSGSGGNDGSIGVGTEQYRTGSSGRGFDADGSTRIDHSYRLTGNTAWTVSFIFDADSVPDPGRAGLVYFGQESANQKILIAYWNYDPNKKSLLVGHDGNDYYTTYKFNTGTEYVVHVTRNSDGTQKLYVDGAYQETWDDGGSLNISTSLGYLIDYGNNRLDGLFDEYKVWAQELTGPQVTEDYNLIFSQDYGITLTGVTLKNLTLGKEG